MVVSNNALGNGLTDGVNLGNVTTTVNSDSNVNVGELVKTSNEEGLVNLVTEDLGLNKGDGGTINLEETLTGLDVGNSSSSLLLTEGLKILVSISSMNVYFTKKIQDLLEIRKHACRNKATRPIKDQKSRGLGFLKYRCR